MINDPIKQLLKYCYCLTIKYESLIYVEVYNVLILMVIKSIHAAYKIFSEIGGHSIAPRIWNFYLCIVFKRGRINAIYNNTIIREPYEIESF